MAESYHRSPESGASAVGVLVRHVRPADLNGWVNLRGALWTDEPRAELAAEAEAFFVAVDPRLAAVLLAEIPGHNLVGFAELALRGYAEDCRTTPVAFLEGWYVVPQLRRQGVGAALVSAAEDWAREQGCDEFASDTQFDNHVSIAAHQALGFIDAGALRCFRKAL